MVPSGLASPVGNDVLPQETSSDSILRLRIMVTPSPPPYVPCGRGAGSASFRPVDTGDALSAPTAR